MGSGPCLRRRRRRKLAWSAVGLLCLAAPLAAQEESRGNNAPPAEKFAISPGGVDMRSGRYVYDQTDLAIGPAEGGLRLARTLTQPVAGHQNPFGNFSHNWDILVSEKRVNIFENNFIHQPGAPDYQIEISFGGRSQSFRAAGASQPFELVSRAGYGILTHSGARSGSGVTYTYTAGDGTVAVFRSLGSADCSTVLRCAYPSQITEPDGTRLTFEYDNQGSPNTTRMRSVTSSRGYALLLEYSGALVVKACVLNLALAPKPGNNICPANALATATYGYGAGGLANATDPSGATWGFTYSGAQMGFVRPGEQSPWLTNTIWQRMNNDGLMEDIVTRQVFADGSSYDYNYAFTPTVYCQVPQVIESIAGGSYTDNLGQTTSLIYDFPYTPFDPQQGHGGVQACTPTDPPNVYVHQVTPGPTTIVDPLGRTTQVDYCDRNAMQNLPQNWIHRCIVQPLPTSTTDPEGIKTEMVWDYGARNLLQSTQIARPGSTQPNGQPWPNIVTSATYTCSPATIKFCNKPTSTTDARDNVTHFTYDPAHGGLLTETGPAVPVRLANGTTVNVQPQTRHAYAQRFARISNGAGGFVQAATPIWLRISTSSCRTSAATGVPAAPCATPGDEVLTTYDYGPDSGPNNLLLRGQTVTSTDGGVTVTLRTCYSYDSLGRRISETQPNANLPSCP